MVRGCVKEVNQKATGLLEGAIIRQSLNSHLSTTTQRPHDLSAWKLEDIYNR